MNKAIRHIRTRMRSIFIAIFSLVAASSSAQLFQEDFGTFTSCNTTRAGNYAGWTALYGATNTADTTNQWFVSAREANMGFGNCGSGCGTNSANQNITLHVGKKLPLDQGAEYNRDSIASIYIYSPAVDLLTNNNDAAITFDYINGGEANDNCQLIIDVGAGAPDLNPAYTINLPKTPTTCGTNGEWGTFTYYLPSALNTIPNVYFGFKWVNNGDTNGTNPSCAVDNIVVDNTLPLPIILVSEDSLCDGGTITFTDSSQGNVDTWAWNFGSTATPSTSSAATVNVTFPNPGIYTVTLTVTNGNGSSQTTMDITVLTCLPPQANFIATDSNICRGQYISFFDMSIPGTFGSGAWAWQFQGGFPNTSTDQNPTNILYTNSGIYSVTMTVTDTASGLSDTLVKNQYINVGTCAVPVAAYLADTIEICNNDSIEFYSLSTGIPDSARWEFIGGNPSILIGTHDSLDTVVVRYNVPGIYFVKLTVWNGAGTNDTVDTINQWITVNNCPQPEPAFTVNSRFVCPGVEVVFEDLSLYATAWYWQFPGGQPSSSTSQNPVNIKYSTPGTYPVILTAYNVNGDSTLNSVGYIVVDSCLPPTSTFYVERDSICRGSCVQFFNTSKRADNFYWVFWGHPIPGSKDTIVAKITEDQILTRDTFIVATDFWPLYMTPDTLIDTIYNENDPIFCFDDSVVVGVQLFTENQNGVEINNSIDIPILNVGGEYPILNPGPDQYVRIDNIESRFYLEDTVTFKTTGTAPFFHWFPEDGLSCFDCPNPIIFPTKTRKYFVTNFDAYGCQAYDSVIVFVEKAYYAGIPNIFSPNGDGNNDILWVRGNAISSDGFTMRVWNRYGDLVYESYTQNDGWDGTFKGIDAPIGTYNYYVKVTFLDGKQDILTGNVTLVRY